MLNKNTLGVKKVRGQQESRQVRPKALILAEQKGCQVTKPIVKICYRLLHIIQGVKSIFDKVTSWPQLISKLLVAPACSLAASDWPCACTFFTPKVFLFSFPLHLSRSGYKVQTIAFILV